MRRTRTTAVVLGAVAAVALGLAGPVPPAGAAPPPADPPAATAGTAMRVTLITGDRVLLRPGGQVEVFPAPGRERMTFRSRTERGHTVVLPADAARLVQLGRLDQRLFDVTLLVRSGYADAQRDDLPLLLTHEPGAAASTVGTARGAGGTAVRPLAAPKAGGSRLWTSLTTTRSAVRKVWLDGKVRATLDRSVPQIGAPAAWRAGHTGAGTTVAVLDTGIDTDHPDFAGAVAVAGSQDFTDNPAGVEDGDGHGTHVASIVTGSGAASAGRYTGVAPDTRLLVGKVLDDGGSGTESGVIAGMEWAAAQHADVVNMSLGSDFQTDGQDPMSLELNRLSRETGTLFVVAAGNSGPSQSSVGSPGAADEALTVGAVDAEDALAEFSARGPRTGDGAIKPDLTGPGVAIVAARAAGSELGDPVGADYQRLSGTSMATPHVAGAAAILAGQHPDWTAARLKAALVASASPSVGADVFGQGSGRVDVARATTQAAWASPVSLNGGIVQWPHQDDVPVVRELTYGNAGPTPLVLDLAADLRGPSGTAAPAGLVELSAGTLTVPAGGTAAVTVTFRTSVEAPDGRYGGLLTATGRDGHTVLRTALTVDREVESYDVTMTVRDQDGAVSPNYYFSFLDLDTGKGEAPYDEDGTVVARLPKGRYLVDGFVQPADGRFDMVSFFEPTVVVSGPGSLEFDGRRGKRPALRTERPADYSWVNVGYRREVADFWVSLGIYAPDFVSMTFAPSRTSTPPGTFTFSVAGLLAGPAGTGDPYQYHVAWSTQRKVPANLVRSFRDRDLARVDSTIGWAGSGRTAMKDGGAVLTRPGTLTELYSPGYDWFGNVQVYDGAPGEGFPALYLIDDRPRRYAAGSRTVERWGRATLGPVLPDDVQDEFGGELPPAVRRGDTMTILPALHGDAAGHSGFATSDGTSELYRDGVLVGEVPWPGGWEWPVPAGPGRFRLTTSATGTGGGGISSDVRATWDFRSAGGGTAMEVLPLLAVRFSPAVDLRNTAPAGRAFTVPVRVDKLTGAKYGRVGTPTVQVSYDEGRTWRAVTVAGGKVRLTHPAGAASVSFKATVADSKDNKVQQTIIRAYLLR